MYLVNYFVCREKWFEIRIYIDLWVEVIGLIGWFEGFEGERLEY